MECVRDEESSWVQAVCLEFTALGMRRAAGVCWGFWVYSVFFIHGALAAGPFKGRERSAYSGASPALPVNAGGFAGCSEGYFFYFLPGRATSGW